MQHKVLRNYSKQKIELKKEEKNCIEMDLESKEEKKECMNIPKADYQNLNEFTENPEDLRYEYCLSKEVTSSENELNNFDVYIGVKDHIYYMVYENLKNNDVEFPEEMESTYEKYLQGNQGDSSVENNKFSNKEINSDNKNYIKRINVDLRTSSYERKYKRLVNKLDDWTQQIQDANIFMDNANEEGFDDDNF